MEETVQWKDVVADLATVIWRMHLRLGAQAHLPDVMNRQKRELEAALDRMEQQGITVLAHTGEPYDPGKALKVIAFDDCEPGESPVITETIKPTIYFRSLLIQRGEVIVGTPAQPTKGEEAH
jgi:hypothetical protein